MISYKMMVEFENDPTMIELMAREVIGRDLILEEFSGTYRGPIKRVGVTVKDWTPISNQVPRSTDCIYFDLEWIAMKSRDSWHIIEAEQDQGSGVRLIMLPIETISFSREEDGSYNLVFPHQGAITINPSGEVLTKEELKSA